VTLPEKDTKISNSRGKYSRTFEGKLIDDATVDRRLLKGILMGKCLKKYRKILMKVMGRGLEGKKIKRRYFVLRQL
jgi:hypothetical protein